jgi:fatty acid-binding protein DegV
LDDGIVEPVARVRTRIKALEHIADLVAKDAASISRVIVISGDATDTDRFVSLLEPSVKVPPSDVWTFGPIVGAHAGPGIVGVGYLVGAEGSEGA